MRVLRFHKADEGTSNSRVLLHPPKTKTNQHDIFPLQRRLRIANIARSPHVRTNSYPVVKRPSDVFEVAIVEEHGGITPHPDANFVGANHSDLWLDVPVNCIINILLSLIIGICWNQQIKNCIT